MHVGAKVTSNFKMRLSRIGWNWFCTVLFERTQILNTCNNLCILQLELLTQQSMRAGFSGGLVVDYPNSTKAKK